MFDLEFFQNDNLIHKLDGLEEDLIFKTKDIIYNHKDKILTRETNEYSYIIDFNKNILSLMLKEMDYNGDVSLLNSSIKDEDNIIEIIYQIDKEEPLNKIIITRRTNER